MTPELATKIAVARKALADSEDGDLAGTIGAPTARVINVLPGWELYREFLQLADGATFGGVDLWSADELPDKQYVSVDFPGQGNRWLAIGQVLYEPVALEKATGRVRLFRVDGDPDGEDLGDFDSLLGRLLGPGYEQLVPDVDDDEWWTLLKAAGLR